MSPRTATLLLAVAFLLAAAAFGASSLYVPGAALAILVCSLGIWVRAASRRPRLEPVPGPWSITEGESYPLGARVAGAGLLPGSSIEHPLAESPLPTGPRPSGLHRLNLRIQRRGRHLLEPPALFVSDPFGLQRRRVSAGESIPVLVLPRVEPVLAPGGAGGLDRLLGTAAHGSGAAGLDPRAVEFEVEGVRPYREGTPASRIHWATVARSGELAERRLVSGGESPPLVVLDAFEPASEEALDRAVRAAASICAHLAADDGCLLLLPGASHPLRIGARMRGWRQAHAKLALVRPCRRPPAGSTLRAARTTFLVSAAASPKPPRLSRSVRFCLVSTEPIAGMRTLFTVAGCRGQAPAGLAAAVGEAA